MRKWLLLPLVITVALLTTSSLMVAQTGHEDVGRALEAMAGEFGAPLTTDPFVGTWKLNLAKSRYDPGPPVKSRTLKAEPAGDGYRAVHDWVDAQGKSVHSENVLRLDGKEYPSDTAQNTTSVTRRIDDRTLESVSRVNGTVALTVRMVVSVDGKTWTTTQIGTNAQGQAVHNVWVYDRQ